MRLFSFRKGATRTVKKAIIVACLLAFAISPLLNILAPYTVQARIPDDEAALLAAGARPNITRLTPEDRNITFILYKWLRGCIAADAGSETVTEITTSELEATDWFTVPGILGQFANPNVGVYVDTYVKGTPSDGPLGCTQDDGIAGIATFVGMLKKMGYSTAEEFLCSIGYDRRVPVQSGCASGTGDLISDLSRSDIALKLDEWWLGAGATELNAFGIGAGAYWHYYLTFLNGCEAKPGTATESERNFTIYEFANSSQPVATKYYLSNEDIGPNNVDVAQYPGTSRHCDEIASFIDDDITDKPLIWMSDYMRDNTGYTPGENVTPPEPETQSSCSIEGIGWIICPVLTTAADLIDGMFDWVAKNFLEIQIGFLSTSGPNSGTYTAWNMVRGIANVAFVVVFLVIIFSQLSSIGVSNYGVKKMLPRLIIAALLVNVSFFVCQLAVDLSNVLGYGIKTMFESLAGTVTDQATTINGGVLVGSSGTSGKDEVLGTIVAGALIAGTATAALAAGLGAIIAVIIAALVAVATIFFILILRQVLVILFIVISPLAFVAYLLPNTEGLFKQWRKVFMSLLLVFPITGLVLGASTLASAILNTIYGNSGNSIGQTIAAGALMVPLIIVPILLKKSLDGIGSLGSMINSAGNKLGAGLGSAGQKGWSNSRLGKFEDYRKKERERRRGLIQSGQYKGSMKNPLNWGRRASSLGNRGLNAMSGQFGKKLSAAGVDASDKIFDEDVAATEKLLRASSKGPQHMIDEASSELTKAIAKGDVVRARAAQSILLNSGNKGVQTLHSTLHSAFGPEGTAHKDSDVGKSLRANLLSSGVKAKNVALDKWSSADEKVPLSMAATQEQISSLNAAELATQGTELLEASRSQISASQAKDVMANDNVFQALDEAKKTLFREIAGVVAPGSNGGSASPSAGTPGGQTLGVGPLDPNNYQQSKNGFIIPKDKK